MIYIQSTLFLGTMDSGSALCIFLILTYMDFRFKCLHLKLPPFECIEASGIATVPPTSLMGPRGTALVADSFPDQPKVRAVCAIAIPHTSCM